MSGSDIVPVGPAYPSDRRKLDKLSMGGRVFMELRVIYSDPLEAATKKQLFALFRSVHKKLSFCAPFTRRYNPLASPSAATSLLPVVLREERIEPILHIRAAETGPFEKPRFFPLVIAEITAMSEDVAPGNPNHFSSRTLFGVSRAAAVFMAAGIPVALFYQIHAGQSPFFVVGKSLLTHRPLPSNDILLNPYSPRLATRAERVSAGESSFILQSAQNLHIYLRRNPHNTTMGPAVL